MSNFWLWRSLHLSQSCILWCHHFLRRTSPFYQLFVVFQVMLWYRKLCLPVASHSALREVDLSVWINRPCSYYVHTRTWIGLKGKRVFGFVFSVFSLFPNEVLVFSDNKVWHSSFFGVIWALIFGGQMDDDPQNSCINGSFGKIPAWMFGSLYCGILNMFSNSNYLEILFFPLT